jgi:hypothetical protein
VISGALWTISSAIASLVLLNSTGWIFCEIMKFKELTESIYWTFLIETSLHISLETIWWIIPSFISKTWPILPEFVETIRKDPKPSEISKTITENTQLRDLFESHFYDRSTKSYLQCIPTIVSLLFIVLSLGCS